MTDDDFSHTRVGETLLPIDPATLAADAGLVYVGKVVSPWRERAQCPKNMNQARETGQPACIEIAGDYRGALQGLDAHSHIIVLTHFHQARRDLALQRPRHRETATGTFALRSPVRPNPIGVHIVRLTRLDMTAGRLELEAIDALDGTPVIDIKPYLPSVDCIADAQVLR